MLLYLSIVINVKLELLVPIRLFKFSIAEFVFAKNTMFLYSNILEIILIVSVFPHPADPYNNATFELTKIFLHMSYFLESVKT